jgi:hypothetical protein
MAGLRATGTLAHLGVLLFWAGVLGAGAVVDGYSAQDDYISSLAARGSPVAWAAIAALSASAVAHAATARAVLGAWRGRLAAGLVLSSGVAVVAVAALRQSCPDGPAGCSRAGRAATGDWLDAAHGLAVGAYAALILGAMLALAGAARVGGTAVPRWLRRASLLFAAGSTAFLSQVGGEHAGLWQRLWVADNLAWLLLVATAAAWGRPARAPMRAPCGADGAGPARAPRPGSAPPRSPSAAGRRDSRRGRRPGRRGTG